MTSQRQLGSHVQETLDPKVSIFLLMFCFPFSKVARSGQHCTLISMLAQPLLSDICTLHVCHLSDLGLLPLMHWQKEHNFEALSPENQVQPTNKSREEETHVGTVMQLQSLSRTTQNVSQKQRSINKTDRKQQKCRVFRRKQKVSKPQRWNPKLSITAMMLHEEAQCTWGPRGCKLCPRLSFFKRALRSFNITNISEVIRQPFSIRLYELHILEHVQLIQIEMYPITNQNISFFLFFFFLFAF